MYIVIKQRSPGVYFALLQAPFYLNLFSFFFFLSNSSHDSWLEVYGFMHLL